MGSIPVAGAKIKESTLVVDSFILHPHGEHTSQAKRSEIGFESQPRRLPWRPRKARLIPVAGSHKRSAITFADRFL